MGMIILFLLILRMIPSTLSCLQTVPGGNPSTGISTTTTPTVTTTTTTVASTDCCPALTQTLTSLSFPDGTMTFAYNSDTCRTTASATCTTTDSSLDLYAAIIGNTVNYLDYALSQVVVPFTCSGGVWQFTSGGSTLPIETLECVLTNPPTTP